MYEQIKSAQRKTEESKITVGEVNMTKRFITGRDFRGASVHVSFDYLDPLVAIPQVGEIWVVKRYGIEWRLVRRLEIGSELTSVETMQPGDKRLEADNDLYLNAGHNVTVNTTNDMTVASNNDISLASGNDLALTGKRVLVDGKMFSSGVAIPNGLIDAPLGSIYTQTGLLNQDNSVWVKQTDEGTAEGWTKYVSSNIFVQAELTRPIDINYWTPVTSQPHVCFSNATSDVGSVLWSTRIPEDWESGDISLQIMMRSDTTSNTNVRFTWNTIRFREGVPYVVLENATEQLVGNWAVNAGKVISKRFPAERFIPGDSLRWWLTRTGAHASDTYPGSIYWDAAWIKYTGRILDPTTGKSVMDPTTERTVNTAT